MKIKKALKYLAFLCGLAIFVHLSIEPLYTPTALLTPSHLSYFPKYIAHQAIISGDFKGNSLEAVQESLASYVDGIEVDVRLSKDNVLFLYHGDTLEEATNGQGKPEEHTWAELEQLSYNDNSGSRLVTLEDYFKLVGSQKFTFLDIKTDKIFNRYLAVEIIKLIHRYHLQETVVVESFNPLFLTSMRLHARDVLLMIDFTFSSQAIGEEIQAQFDKIPWLLKQPFLQKQIRRIVRPDVLGPRFDIDKQQLKTLIDDGYAVIAWTVDDPQVAKELFALGIQGIQTNTPLQLLDAIPAKAQVVYDAGGTAVQPAKIIHVKSVQDILAAITDAKSTKHKIVVAGRRHSMGGQALLDNAIQLNMLGLNQVTYNPQTQTVTAGAGATWKKVQAVLDQYQRSVVIMQSDNIFTVGGSLSVNVHGWQVGVPPIISTVQAMTVITADGKLRQVTKNKDPELFKAIIGGYGLFAVMVDVELATVANSTLTFHAKFTTPEEFQHSYKQNVTDNPQVELAYARLSVDQAKLFTEVGLFWYAREQHSQTVPLQPESLVAFKRGVFRASQYFELGKKLRWSVEKLHAQAMSKGTLISRNNAMNTDVHILWPLYGKNKDILQEYFIPKDNISLFIEAFKQKILQHNMNILNVTMREVRQDQDSFLPYATKDVFGLVCLFSQQQTAADEAKMQQFTQEVIDDVLRLGGTFYLPYRHHYRKEQLLKAYPNILTLIKLKKKWDLDGIFDSHFFQSLKFIWR